MDDSDYNIRDTLLKLIPSVKECGVPVWKVCGKVIPAKGGNTSNVLTHLRNQINTLKHGVAKKACLTKGKGLRSTLCELQKNSMKYMYSSQSNIATQQ